MKNNFSLNLLSSLLVICLSTVALQKHVLATPLFTNSRWIVDEDGNRVKLACVNWPDHLQPAVAEGLSKKPVDVISEKIRSMGFNCVRLTWPLALINNHTLASMTVENSFKSLGLYESLGGIKVNNERFLNMSLSQVFKNVVSSLGDNNIMVILDNHITTPGWCCSNNDSSAFFGDKDFDPKLWIKGLGRMATMFKGTKNVIGMSLRNELRGPNQNVKAWYRYMQRGAEAVHAANPEVLVVLSGLYFDTDLSFLRKKQVKVSFTKKLVFEGHWYAFTENATAWVESNHNDYCGIFMNNIQNNYTFLLKQGYPVFLGEFGTDQTGLNENGNRFFNCILGFIADWDMDWSLWALQGSYYLRGGVYAMDETYGLLSYDWESVRNSSYLRRLQAVQSPFQGVGLGLPPRLGNDCTNSSSKWEMISNSRMHLSSELASGERVCLDVSKDGTIITNQCKCLAKDPKCDPTISYMAERVVGHGSVGIVFQIFRPLATWLSMLLGMDHV
ncbi:hypothetical protein IFM89_033804 [Coptis chinensis]|uniref:Glycoside hydrolase family 5 domain-containing protein n=1 Tax=Coptis chinensis TaxID=261450 RepID=A0A835HR62_9MAGN|nr:hypothetical protein IFM89_033804 [Coptis chinensis]